jgi:hypothetical protein
VAFPDSAHVVEYRSRPRVRIGEPHGDRLGRGSEVVPVQGPPRGAHLRVWAPPSRMRAVSGRHKRHSNRLGAPISRLDFPRQPLDDLDFSPREELTNGHVQFE